MTSRLDAAGGYEGLTPDWLTAALTAAGVLRHGIVASAEWQRVGEDYGFTGLVGRVRLRYDGANPDAPASVIAKLPMADVASGYRARQERDPELARRHFERCIREVLLYREIVDAPAPAFFHAAVDDDEKRVVLLLEDLTTGRQGDALRGCSIEEAALVIDELAPFHARHWGDRAPVDAFPRLGDDPQARQARYDAQLDVFLPRHGEQVPPEMHRVAERLRSRLAAVVTGLDGGPRTLIHADLQLDNVLFDVRDEGRPVVLDWQTAYVGAPALDVATFLFGSLSVEDRRAGEVTLLERYAALLAEHGVRGYGVDDLRLDCRLALLVLLAGTVGWLASVDPNEVSAREQALQHAAITDGRLAGALMDHAVEALL